MHDERVIDRIPLVVVNMTWGRWWRENKKLTNVICNIFNNKCMPNPPSKAHSEEQLDAVRATPAHAINKSSQIISNRTTLEQAVRFVPAWTHLIVIEFRSLKSSASIEARQILAHSLGNSSTTQTVAWRAAMPRQTGHTMAERQNILCIFFFRTEPARRFFRFSMRWWHRVRRSATAA